MTGGFRSTWKKYWVVCTGNNLYTKVKKDDSVTKKCVSLDRVLSLQYTKTKEKKSNTLCLNIQTSSKKEESFWLLSAASEREAEEWLLLIDGIKSDVFASMLTPNLKQEILASIYFVGFKGGRVKNNFDEEWNYDGQTGLLTNTFISLEGNFLYKWNGHLLKPATNYVGPTNCGFGKWDGFTIAWFNENERLVEEYVYYSPTSEFLTANEELSWEWSSEKSSLFSKFGGGEWVCEGNIPFPVVMFLQLMRYVSLTAGLDDL